MSIISLLLLCDGRFPAGGHAHSSGLESAVAAGRVTDLATLESFLRGRLATSGLVSAAFTAAAHAITDQPAMSILDAELDARVPSPALRSASRRQGRALVRAARNTWPVNRCGLLPAHPDGPHHALVLGVTAAAAGLAAREAALVAVYGQVTGQASAAVRLLGLDPYQVQFLLARLGPDCETLAGEAAGAAAHLSPDQLPMLSAPLADISAEIHATWEVRLFAS